MSHNPSVLGKYFVDAQFALTGAGLLLGVTNNNPSNSTTLVLAGASGSVPELTADTSRVTADGLDRADSNAPLLGAPYVIIQTPNPGQVTNVGIGGSSATAIGYSVPTVQRGPIPVP
ncbi:MAG TPA: hypothetical protein VF764_12225 [Steroidobacteraceae bacterium]